MDLGGSSDYSAEKAVNDVPAIEFHDIAFSYDEERVIFDKLNLRIKKERIQHWWEAQVVENPLYSRSFAASISNSQVSMSYLDIIIRNGI